MTILPSHDLVTTISFVFGTALQVGHMVPGRILRLTMGSCSMPVPHRGVLKALPEELVSVWWAYFSCGVSVLYVVCLVFGEFRLWSGWNKIDKIWHTGILVQTTTISYLSSFCKCLEVLYSLGYSLSEQSNHNTASIFSPNFNIEVNLGKYKLTATHYISTYPASSSFK